MIRIDAWIGINCIRTDMQTHFISDQFLPVDKKHFHFAYGIHCN